MHLNRSVEAGEPFVNRQTRKVPVVYVNYEMALNYFVELANSHPIPETFFVVNRPEPKLQPETIRGDNYCSAMNERGFVKGLVADICDPSP